jgi:DNA-binding LacI/PurR family transcriptional regulator
MITLSKLAKLAHVSVSTVSKAFSMSEEVNEQTREEVFRIAKEYGCFKKYYKAKYPKTVIAVLCPEFQSRFYSDALTVLQQYLSAHNCEICVASTDFSKEKRRELLHYYNRYTSVDGVIVIDGNVELDEEQELPIAVLGSVTLGEADICISTDYLPALREALRYFKKRGRSIGFVGDPYTGGKLRKLQMLAEEEDVPFAQEHICVSRVRFEAGGYEAMERLLTGETMPDAVICGYDYLAMGAIRCACDRGLSVPEDIAVMGMDDIHEAAFLNPPLTSINFRIDEACRLAADALMARLMDGEYTKQQTLVSRLCLRRSTEI